MPYNVVYGPYTPLTAAPADDVAPFDPFAPAAPALPVDDDLPPPYDAYGNESATPLLVVR